ncbi:nuclear transport factor 2 family protein [Mycolicibacterium palauense]|uniref:nuclear transport factor 2 family protein n=1 Tax=Mycolicibacterium palauense TaxID=2034511 RepID=UPI000BFF03D3|nr:nuclear transport factor 2 family protein [Mycolicibacterium palauense]
MSDTLHVVEQYNYEIWNRQRYELAPEIIGAEVIRNGAGTRDVLTHEMAVERIKQAWSSVQHVTFELIHTVVEGELCTIVYQADLRKLDGTPDSIASIEVFRVVDGRIVEVWNNAHEHGRWPEAKELPA